MKNSLGELILTGSSLKFEILGSLGKRRLFLSP